MDDHTAIEADNQHWSMCAYWTLDEAVALSLGLDPRYISIGMVNKDQTWSSRLEKEYVKRFEIVTRARQAKQIEDKMAPGFFLGWAKGRGLTYPEELEKAVLARGLQIGDWKTENDEMKKENAQLSEQNKRLVQEKDVLLEQARSRANEEKPLHTKERQSLLKLVYGMANGGYKYDDDKAEAVKEICNDLDLNGVSLNPDTVRRYLREGADLRYREGQ